MDSVYCWWGIELLSKMLLKELKLRTLLKRTGLQVRYRFLLKAFRFHWDFECFFLCIELTWRIIFFWEEKKSFSVRNDGYIGYWGLKSPFIKGCAFVLNFCCASQLLFRCPSIFPRRSNNENRRNWSLNMD